MSGRGGWVSEHVGTFLIGPDGLFSKDVLHLNKRVRCGCSWERFLESSGGWDWETVFKLGGKGGGELTQKEVVMWEILRLI